MTTIKHAHLAVEFWLKLDGEQDLTPLLVIFLCAISHGNKTGVGDVAETMDCLRGKAFNALNRLHEREYIDRIDRGIYRINGKGIKKIKELFPFTYIRNETNASV